MLKVLSEFWNTGTFPLQIVLHSLAKYSERLILHELLLRHYYKHLFSD